MPLTNLLLTPADLLIFFHDATNELQRDNMVTMNKVISLVMLLEKCLIFDTK